jgi:hypothetical protein
MPVNEVKPPVIPDDTARLVEVEVLPPAPPRSAPFSGPQSSAPGRNRFRVALVIAILVDALQIGFFPLFGPGFASPAAVVLDICAFLVFWRLVGWHIALLPTFLFEQVPLVDLAPTWTIAVWIATRRMDPPQTTPTGQGPLSS